MKQCNHTFWLGLSSRGKGTDLLVSDRVQNLTNYIHDPDVLRPSLLVLVGNTAKTTALRQTFGVKRARRLSIKRDPAEIHLHLDPSSIFERPLFIADSDLSNKLKANVGTDTCHEITRASIRGPGSGLGHIAGALYTRLLGPFVDVFCFFCDDLGGLGAVASHLAAWLEHSERSTLPMSTRARVVLVTERIPTGARSEHDARTAFLNTLGEKTKRNPSDQFSAIDVVALFPSNAISVEARHRHLKERLMNSSDQVRKGREDAQLLFSAVHFASLLEIAPKHFSGGLERPFDFIRASRTYNPIAEDFAEHIHTFLSHIKLPEELTGFAAPVVASSFLFDQYPPDAHSFPSKEVFKVLYKNILTQASRRVISFEESPDVYLRSGFISIVEAHFVKYTEQLQRGSELAAELHHENLGLHRSHWRSIHSSSTCFACLRERPQYRLYCGHIVCGNCVLVYGEPSSDDPWEFNIRQCFVCMTTMPEKVTIRMHPPTAGVGVFCVDGGGVRGAASLKLIKRIQDRINLPIPFQRLFKVAFGISSGGLIIADIFLNGHSVERSTERFENFVREVFKRRWALNLPFAPRFLKSLMPYVADGLYPLPFLLRALELLISYFADGLYPAKNIESALKQAFGASRSILDSSNATFTGTFVGLPVATVDNNPSCRIFTNYNGVGKRRSDQDHVIKPKEGFGRVLLWEIARAASAAPGFFPPKHIPGVGTFQDAGPLENDPLIDALSEVSALFPLLEEPDFLVSVGSGEPKPSRGLSTTAARWRNGALPRLYRLVWEKMRDRKVRQVFQAHPRYHRLNIQFDGEEPRLDDVQSIPDVESQAMEDESLHEVLSNIARSVVASLFYFELAEVPQRTGGKYTGTGHIFCLVRRGDPAFAVLFDRLCESSAQFWINGCPVDVNGNCFGSDGNFRKQVNLNTDDRLEVTLKQDSAGLCNISGSPFSVKKLQQLQGFSAVFGRPDHQKKKLSVPPYGCKRKISEPLYSMKKKQRRTL